MPPAQFQFVGLTPFSASLAAILSIYRRADIGEINYGVSPRAGDFRVWSFFRVLPAS
jgi:hypothetical protein